MSQVELMSLALVEVQNLDKPRDLYHRLLVSKQHVALTAMLFRAVADQPQCKVPEGYITGLNLWGAYATKKVLMRELLRIVLLAVEPLRHRR